MVAAFSSRGPAPIDENAKPDLVAPGVNIESTADPSSALFAANPASRLWGTIKTGSEPYLSLTGTSMAAPVVTGAIALMLEANAALTPNAVKAILEYTAEARDGYNHLTQGAGFLNARGAVELARAFAGTALAPELSSDPVRWSRHIIWGNRRVAGGMLGARANAWKPGRDVGRRADAGGRADRLGRRRAATANECTGCQDGPLQRATPDCDLRRWTAWSDSARPAAPAHVSMRWQDAMRAACSAERRARQPTTVAGRGSARMKTLPTPARVYVGSVIGLGARAARRVLPRPGVQPTRTAHGCSACCCSSRRSPRSSR